MGSGTATSGAVEGYSSCEEAAALAASPGSGGVARRAPAKAGPARARSWREAGAGWRGALLGQLALSAALVAAWLVVYPRTPDMAAQLYRVQLFHQVGLALWDDNWYAGHGALGYSLLYPPLAALLGMRALGALSVLASSVLFARLAWEEWGARARWGAAWFALAALGDVWSGRLTFALGVALALAAALALARGRPWAAALLGLACTAASPVAGALLGLAALTLALERRSPRALVALAAPGAALVAALALLFPEGGYEPFPFLSFAATLAVTLAFLAALPARAGRASLLRTGAGVYLLACVGCLLVRTPIGSNVERYGVLLSGPLLLCAWLGQPRESGRSRHGEARAPGRWPAPARWLGALPVRGGRLPPTALAALAGSALWLVWGPVRETRAVAGSAATSASFYAPVKRFLAEHARGPVRVEVPLTRSHWEAALLAPSVALARGWDKQMETRYDGALLSGELGAGGYRRWLLQQAVSYVALPDVPLDGSSAREGRLIRAGLPYLREVFASAHWRIYEVLGAAPLAQGPGRLSALSHESFTLRARAGGRFLVRVHFTRYWTLVRGAGCVAPAAGGWTEVTLRHAGEAVVAARFSLARAFSSGASCSRGAA
ncbi:MAG TPA: hypothetical protein VL979_14920 [Solirubrobacteraceae bacterium]|nr:hypothetical protein [Solirubrobacteraceae bacterium]